MSTIAGREVFVLLVSRVCNLLCTDCLFLDAQEVKKALRKVAATAAQTNRDHSLVEVPSPCRENTGSGDGLGSGCNVSHDDTPPSSDGGSGAPVPAPRLKRRKNDEHKNSSSKLSGKKASKTAAAEKTKLDSIGEIVEKTASPAQTDTHELGRTGSLTSSNASLLDSSDVSVSREDDSEREMEAGVWRMFLLRCMLYVEHPTLEA